MNDSLGLRVCCGLAFKDKTLKSLSLGSKEKANTAISLITRIDIYFEIGPACLLISMVELHCTQPCSSAGLYCKIYISQREAVLVMK